MPSSFSIQAVAERTGLTPHVIRAWERRYRAIEPERSAGKHRLYSEAEIERLVMLNRAVRKGHSIGKIAALPTEELRALLSRPPAFATPARPVNPRQGDTMAPFQSDALAAVRRYDAPALEAALRSALLALGHQGFLRLAVAPLAEEVGECWRSGELTAAHEHFFTATAKFFLGDLTRQFSVPQNAPRIIVTTPSGQLHELGALMTASEAANLGWRAIYLGPSMPAYEIAGAALSNQAAAVALSIVYPEDDPAVASELNTLASLVPASVRILVGGRAAQGYFETITEIGALYADNIEEFGNQLDSLRQTPAHP